jgi:hypothetical protein
MKTKLSLILIATILSSGANSQSTAYTMPFTGIKKVIIHDLYGNITIEGRDSRIFQIVRNDQKKQLPVHAERVKPDSYKPTKLGFAGLFYENYRGTITLTPQNLVSQFTDYTIRMPFDAQLEISLPGLKEGMKLDDSDSSFFNTIIISGIQNDIVIGSLVSDIKVLNVTGSLSVSALKSNCYIDISKLNQSKSYYISVFTGNVDMILPSRSRFDIDYSGGFGSLFSEFDIYVKEILPISKDKAFPDAEEFNKNWIDKTVNTGKKYEVSKLKGKVNAGGSVISINTFTGNSNFKKK